MIINKILCTKLSLKFYLLITIGFVLLNSTNALSTFLIHHTKITSSDFYSMPFNFISLKAEQILPSVWSFFTNGCTYAFSSVFPQQQLPLWFFTDNDYNKHQMDISNTICILIPVTSRTHEHEWHQLSDSFFYQKPLLSLSQSIKQNKDPYQYKLFLGYDIGDPFFDNQTTLKQLTSYVNQNLSNLSFTLETRAIQNKHKQPVTILNYLSNEAYYNGCDFMYHIDDDTEFITSNWAKPLVSALKNFKPPFFGVVGPTCYEGNTAILTHDFVHRSHLDRFSTHYPPELSSWWFDNWISEVYGINHTLKLKNVLVKDHLELSMANGLRYSIIWESAYLLRPLIEKGRQHLFNLLIAMNHQWIYIQE